MSLRAESLYQLQGLGLNGYAGQKLSRNYNLATLSSRSARKASARLEAGSPSRAGFAREWGASQRGSRAEGSAPRLFLRPQAERQL